MARTNPYDIVVSPVDSGASFKRTKKVALDYTSVQNNYAEALAFVTSTTSNAYIGQYIYVHEDSVIDGKTYTAGAYVVEGLKDAAKLTKLASGENLAGSIDEITEAVDGIKTTVEGINISIQETPEAGYAATYVLNVGNVEKGKINVPEVNILEGETGVATSVTDGDLFPGAIAGHVYLKLKFAGRTDFDFIDLQDLVQTNKEGAYISIESDGTIAVKYADLKAALLADEEVGGVLGDHTDAILDLQKKVGIPGSAPDHADASGIYKIIIDNEEVTSAALNDLDVRITDETGALGNAKVDKTTTINNYSLSENVELKTGDIKLATSLDLGEVTRAADGEQTVQVALETMLALIRGNENALTWVVAE